jgi:hypothetical protein
MIEKVFCQRGWECLIHEPKLQSVDHGYANAGPHGILVPGIQGHIVWVVSG